MRTKKKYVHGGAHIPRPAKKDDALKQAEERSFSDYGYDFLRALSQPLNYMREIGEGNYLPNQAELEARGISPMESVAALANPADHIYAALAASDIIDDKNFKSKDGVSYGSPGLLSLLTGSSPQKVSKNLEKSIQALKDAGIKSFTELRYKDLSKFPEEVKNAAKDVAQVVDNSQRFLSDLAKEVGEGSSEKINRAMANYVMEKNPSIMATYDPNSPIGKNPFLQSMLDTDAELFSRNYLTSYRGVGAKDADQARKFLVSTKGSGDRALNEGIYSTDDIQTAMSYANPEINPFRGPGSDEFSGFVGKIRQTPAQGTSYQEILRDLAAREKAGLSGGRGFQTDGGVRVIRDPKNIEIEDVVPLDQAKKLTGSNYYGGDLDVTPFFTKKDFNYGGTFKIKKKAQGGMKVKKNGDPPKGYRYDADGYLTPVGFSEFHEEGDGPRGLSTDAFLAGITAAESSSSPTTKQELTDVFTRKRDLRNALGSSAGGAAQVIPGFFKGEDTQTDQYGFMTKRVDEGVSGESSLRQQAKQNYDRYEKEIPQEVWNSLGLTQEDFMAGFHFAGSGRFRGYMADLREGRLTPQEFLDKKPTSGNMTMGEYLNRFREGSAAYRD